MRIIAGTAKGTKMQLVPGDQTRPIADRVKESLFQIIGPFFDGGLVLDLFAGTGSLGLEALSRGVDKAVFVDQSSASIKTILTNARLTRFDEHVTVYRREVFVVLCQLLADKNLFSIVFLDPPYDKDKLLLSSLDKLSTGELLEPDAIVVVKSASNIQLPTSVGRLQLYRKLTYGITTIHLFEREPDPQ